MHYYSFGKGILAYASKEPVAIILETPGGKWALDLDGHPIPLEQLPLDKQQDHPSTNGATT